MEHVNDLLGLSGYELIMLVGMAVGVLALLAIGAALVKLAFWGPAERHENTAHHKNADEHR